MYKVDEVCKRAVIEIVETLMPIINKNIQNHDYTAKKNK